MTFCLQYAIIAIEFLLTFLPDSGKHRPIRTKHDKQRPISDQQMLTESTTLLSNPKLQKQVEVNHGITKETIKVKHESSDGGEKPAKTNPQNLVSFPAHVVFSWMTG